MLFPKSLFFCYFYGLFIIQLQNITIAQYYEEICIKIFPAKATIPAKSNLTKLMKLKRRVQSRQSISLETCWIRSSFPGVHSFETTAYTIVFYDLREPWVGHDAPPSKPLKIDFTSFKRVSNISFSLLLWINAGEFIIDSSPLELSSSSPSAAI